MPESGSVNAIEIEGLSKTYGSGGRRVVALENVSIHVRQGEIYGLLGRNGAGKTTIVKCLLDIVRPTGGRSAILGRPSSDPAARRPVGYLPEDHRFPEHRSGLATLHHSASLSGLSVAERRARIPALVERMGLGDAADRKVRSYSKGMKQRLGLAQALVHDPEVLFLDEPTDGVDPVGRAEVRRLLEQLRSEGKSIFLNSHLLSEVEQICDRVGILERGRLVREGELAALTHAGLIYRIVTEPALDEATLALIAERVVTVAPAARGIEVSLREASEIDALIDLLRARGIGLRQLEGKRWSLEEVFLQAVEPPVEAAP